ncbi:MAG: hypothetical protein HOL22_07700 [Euryarchaeota archaeon]|jgi:hypothetical protein|nr:hypothetical protein [Euryarchaeota archaeon]MBT5594955.1 hypothetical protein [Euryarchaeota archaeon]MBT5843894.1 hypothetical protein [Euryarchaeota archaeon]MBT6641350.1 hypothetical protein [Euryarchaeota archaeon]MBT6845234.1 hypothetical protein [Euryarchaeota archaeon]
MNSSETFHVVATELVVGAFSVAGLSFTLLLLVHFGILKQPSWISMFDHVAHFTLTFGLAATPFAILSGLSSAPGEGLNSPILVNKIFLSMTGFGFAVGCLIVRWRLGNNVWDSKKSTSFHVASGLAACGLMLLTASAGGTFSRGESLLDMFHLPYEHVLLFPILVSLISLFLGLAILVLSWKRMNAISSIH